jgi:VWFA-related protein
MPHSMTSSLVSLVAAGALAGLVGPFPLEEERAPADGKSLGRLQQTRGRVVHVSATDKSGRPVTDLQAADFLVKEDGKTQEVVEVRPAAMPLRVAVLVADAGSGVFQPGLSRFVNRLRGNAEIAVTSVILQPDKILDYSSDAGAVAMALQRLGRRGQPQGGAQLMEAILEATQEVSRDETSRPVILALRVGFEDATSIPPNDVRDRLRRSGAILHVISTIGAQRAAPSQARGTDPVSVQQGQLRDSELAQGAFALAQVLGDGSKESGGRHEEIVSTTLVTALERLADELLNQYEITYRGPGGKSGDKLAVTSNRKGVTVRGPGRVR